MGENLCNPGLEKNVSDAILKSLCVKWHFGFHSIKNFCLKDTIKIKR